MNRISRLWTGRTLPALILCASLPMAGCTKTMGSAGIEAACAAWQPVTWSKSDSEQTIREVKANNAAWAAYCRK